MGDSEDDVAGLEDLALADELLHPIWNLGRNTMTAPARPAPGRPSPTNAPPRSAPATSSGPISFKPMQASPQPLKILFYAVEGFGKTSMGAHTNKPFMLMGQAETGYSDLLAAGRVPAVPGLRVDTFKQALDTLDSLAKDHGDRQTLVVDSLTTFEDMVMDEVCREHFSGDWGPQGFQSYGKGYAMVSTEWMKLLARLDKVAQSGLDVVMLAHTAIKTFDNPTGASFKRYSVDLYDSEKASTLQATKAFATDILFGNFLTIVEVGKAEAKKNIADQKGKGIGDTVRMLYTERRDTWDAKNRRGMPPEIELVNDPTQTWAQVWEAITNTGR